MRYALIRPPSTQEDEGRSFLVGTYPSLEAAEEAKEEHDGYYTHEIFELTKQTNTPRWIGALLFNSRKAGAGQVVTGIYETEDPLQVFYRLQEEAIRNPKHGGALVIRGFHVQEVPEGR